MKVFEVSVGSNIPGSHDSVVVLAKNEDDALKKAKPLLNDKRLVPDFLNKYRRYNIKIHE